MESERIAVLEEQVRAMRRDFAELRNDVRRLLYERAQSKSIARDASRRSARTVALVSLVCVGVQTLVMVAVWLGHGG